MVAVDHTDARYELVLNEKQPTAKQFAAVLLLFKLGRQDTVRFFVAGDIGRETGFRQDRIP
jgi:hypothetical protein